MSVNEHLCDGSNIVKFSIRAGQHETEEIADHCGFNAVPGVKETNANQTGHNQNDTEITQACQDHLTSLILTRHDGR